MIGEVLHESSVSNCTQHTFSLHPIRGFGFVVDRQDPWFAPQATERRCFAANR